MDFSKWKCFQIGTAKTEPASIQRRLNCCNICNFLSQDTISYQIARQERIFLIHFRRWGLNICLDLQLRTYASRYGVVAFTHLCLKVESI